MSEKQRDYAQARSILATDCGSTTTKAILIELVDGEYRQTFRGEAPTTVEAPFEDVTRGVLNAVLEVEELAVRRTPSAGSSTARRSSRPWRATAAWTSTSPRRARAAACR